MLEQPIKLSSFFRKKISTKTGIIVILSLLIAVGISYQYLWLPYQKIPITEKETKPLVEEEREEFVEVLLEKLKEGENKIGNIIVEKIVSEVEKEFRGERYLEKILSSFIYRNNKYLEEVIFPGVPQPAEFNVYLVKKDGDSKLVNNYEADDVVYLGFRNWVYILGSFRRRYGSGFSDHGFILSSFNENGSGDKKNPTIGIGPYEDIFQRHPYPEKLSRGLSLIIKDEKLYVRARNSYCYYYLIRPYYLEYIPMGCVDEYFFVEEGKIIKSNSEFKIKYLMEVKEYDGILSRTKNDWLSPLLGRTLNYIFAEEEEKAWQEFDKDFAKFSEKYPLPEQKKIDPLKIKEEIQKQLSERESI